MSFNDSSGEKFRFYRNWPLDGAQLNENSPAQSTILKQSKNSLKKETFDSNFGYCIYRIVLQHEQHFYWVCQTSYNIYLYVTSLQ